MVNSFAPGLQEHCQQQFATIWFMGVYPQGPRKGALSNLTYNVPPTHILSEQGDPLCSQMGN